MELREGMLGVIVIALALTGALFLSYFAGIESEEYEVTKYEYLADVSGMFEYDKSPTYIEFDPSSNYTGYYSEDTGEYWPEEQVGYQPNIDATTGQIRVNNYRINLASIEEGSGQYDLSQISISDVDDYKWIVSYIHYDSGSTTNFKTSMWRGDAYYLKDVLEALDLDEYTEVRISLADANWPTSGPLSVDIGTPVFVPISWFDSNSSINPTQYDYREVFLLATDISKDSYQSTRVVHYPVQSMIIKGNNVQLYSDLEYKNILNQATTGSIVVFYGDADVGFAMDFGDTFSADYTIYPENSYLNPNYGVTMKD